MRGKNYLWTLFILMFLASMAMVSVPVTPSPGVTFRVEPELTTGVPADEMVTVDVYIDADSDTAVVAWGIVMKVNPDVLKPGYLVMPGVEILAVSGEEGYYLYGWCIAYPWDPDPGKSPTLFLPGSKDEAAGVINGTVESIKLWTELPVGVGANGTGKLATFYFTSKNETAYSPIEIVDAAYWTSWLSPDPDKHVPDIINGRYNVPPLLVHEVTVAGQTYYVVTESNSSRSNFTFNEAYAADTQRGETSFNVSGPAGTIGFCNITIPKNLTTGDPWLVLVDGAEKEHTTGDIDATHTWLYFTYTHGDAPGLVQIYGTWVVPEFASFTPLLLLMIATIVAAIISKKLWSTRRIGRTRQIKRNFIQPG